MRSPGEWYLRRYMGLAGAVLVIIGTWTAIVLIPTILLAIALFVLIGGSGLFIAYRQKNVIKIAAATSLGPAWFYFFTRVTLYYADGAHFLALFYDSAKIALVVAAISVALALSWSAGKERTNRVPLILLALVILVPFIIGGLHDYNRRADTSPPELINMEIMAKYSKTDSEGDEVPWWMTAETPDGDLRVEFRATESYYETHDIGSPCQIIAHKGALGYLWIEGYVH